MKLAKFILNDPVSKNALSLKQAEALAQKLQLGSKAPSYDAVLFSAKGSHFCSGGNLSDYAGMKTPLQGKAVNRRIAAILDQLSSLPVPTACIVQGDCLGGGLELLGSFDYVVSVPEAQFGFWQRKIALSFGWGGRKRLAQRMSEAKLNQLAFSARNLSAQEALEIGLIDEISLCTRAQNKAQEWLKKTSKLPSMPLRECKKLMGKRMSQASAETKLFEKLWWNEEHRDVLRKFKK